MTPVAVVVVDPGGDSSAGFLLGSERDTGQQFVLEGGEERLGRGGRALSEFR